MTKQLPYPYTQDQLIAFLKAINCNPYPVPLPPEKLASLRFAKYREFNGETVALPNVLKQILLIDQDYALGYDSNRFLYPLFDCLDHDTGIFYSVDLGQIMTEWVNYQQEELGGQEAEDGQANHLVFKWNPFNKAPSVLPFGHIGDQQLFFYVAEPSQQAATPPLAAALQPEYPIVRLDTQEFSLWISEISLVHYMGNIADCDMSAFEAQLEGCQDQFKDLSCQEFYGMVE